MFTRNAARKVSTKLSNAGYDSDTKSAFTAPERASGSEGYYIVVRDQRTGSEITELHEDSDVESFFKA